MFPITCNAFGDILAAIQLMRDIAKALNESRGAAQDCRDFISELTSTCTLMLQAYELTLDSTNRALKDIVLDETRFCCKDLEHANALTSGFEALLSTTTSEANSLSGVRQRISRAPLMLKWRFMKASEAEDCAERFRNRCLRMTTVLTIINGERARQDSEKQQQHAKENTAGVREDIASLANASRKHADAGVSDIRDDIALLSGTTHTHFNNVADEIRVVAASSATHAMQRDAQHSELLENVAGTATIVAAGLSDVDQAVEGQNRRLDEVVSSTSDLPSQTLRMALGVLFINGLWTHGNGATQHSGNDSVVLVDFEGNRTILPVHICGTMASMCSLVHGHIGLERRKGWTFVLRKAYELIDLRTSEVLSATTWTARVRQGLQIELGILLHQKCTNPVLITCPFCNTEFSQQLSSDVYAALSCENCQRSFRSSIITESVPSSDVSSAVPSSVLSLQDAEDRFDSGLIAPRTSVVSSNESEPTECMQNFARVHAVRVVAASEPSSERSIRRDTSHSISEPPDYSEDLPDIIVSTKVPDPDDTPFPDTQQSRSEDLDMKAVTPTRSGVRVESSLSVVDPRDVDLPALPSGSGSAGKLSLGSKLRKSLSGSNGSGGFSQTESFRLYSAELAKAHHHRGIALALPSPGILDEDGTRRTSPRVKTGDVGYIHCIDGRFVRVFNVHQVIEDPEQHFGVPQDFELFRRRSNLTHSSRGKPAAFMSAGVNQMENSLGISMPVVDDDRGICLFRAVDTPGAILVAPDPIESEDALNLAHYETYAKRNINSWFRFITGELGLVVTPEDIIFVTGADRTTSWATAVTGDRSSGTVIRLGIQYCHVPGHGQLASDITWSSDATLTTSTGPVGQPAFPRSDSASSLSAQSVASGSDTINALNTECDQTLFIRGFRGKSTLSWPRRLTVEKL